LSTDRFKSGAQFIIKIIGIVCNVSAYDEGGIVPVKSVAKFVKFEGRPKDGNAGRCRITMADRDVPI